VGETARSPAKMAQSRATVIAHNLDTAVFTLR